MTTLTLQVDSPSLLEQLKSVFSLMKGVRILTADSAVKRHTVKETPNATTLAAMREAESGLDAGIVRLDSLEGFMSSMEE